MAIQCAADRELFKIVKVNAEIHQKSHTIAAGPAAMATTPSSATTALHVHVSSIVIIKSSWIGAWPFVKLVRRSLLVL